MFLQVQPLRREDLPELHYIAPCSNLRSILLHGILSHKHTSKMKHLSVADDNVQERRKKVHVPGGKPLHEYVNLYINARNPMLYKLKEKHQELCILRVSTAILDLPDVVIADRNASSGYHRHR